MTRKIFIYAFLLGASVLMISVLIFFGLQYSLRMDEVYEALQGEASYAASGLKVGGIEFLYSLDSTNRVTWIASDGSVLYDSMYPDLKTNQGEFNEVRQALEKGNGQGVRRSSSGGTQTMYYAFLCEDGTVLRLSRPLSAVRYAFAAVSPILSVMFLSMIISAAMAFHIARSIAGPVNEMELDELDDLPHASPYPELQPLVERLKEQREVIAQQAVEQEQLRRETMEHQAREQEKMRREFTANVSHELKTPLTSISGFAELMQSGLCDEERMIEFAGDIYRESQRLIALVNDIIRISEIDEGAIRPSSEGVDLVQEVLKTVRILQPAADKRNISISVLTADKEKPGDKEQLVDKEQTADKMQIADKEQTADKIQIADKEQSADKMQIADKEQTADKLQITDKEQTTEGENEVSRPVRIDGSELLIGEMIYNLCDNAIKYNHDGGSVRIEVVQDDKNAVLTVEDTGIGIPAAEQERVFERFYRVDKSHSRQIGGTGLGLSIVKHAAQFHSAAISLESEPGKGTRITVSFPVWEEAERVS